MRQYKNLVMYTLMASFFTLILTGCEPIPPNPPKFAFVTTWEGDGNIGGLAAADAICQTEAEDAELPGTYKAWLSDSSSSPSTRFCPS